MAKPSVWRLAWRAAGRGVVEFYNSSNLTFASSIAFYSLLSFFPFVLLILSLFSRFTVERDDRLLRVIAQVLPRQFDFISSQIEGMADASVKVGVLGTIVLIWASMGVFGALTSAVNHAWGVSEPVGFFKHKAIALVMMLTSGLLLVATLFLMGALEVVQARWFAGFLSHAPWLLHLTSVMSRNAPTPLFVLVLGLVYYFVPNTRVRLRDVWFGAVLAAVLWRLAFSGFAWYVKDLSRFSVHGSVAAVVAFLIWVYLSAVIVLYGVEVTAAYARLRHER